MRIVISVALTTALLMKCASSPAQGLVAPDTSMHDGSSLANAVVIDAQDESAGVKAEYRWIAERFPGYKRVGQALLNGAGHSYDAIDITTASGDHKKIYFDITHFFGKM